jgi:hypothetical protein
MGGVFFSFLFTFAWGYRGLAIGVELTCHIAGNLHFFYKF